MLRLRDAEPCEWDAAIANDQAARLQPAEVAPHLAPPDDAEQAAVEREDAAVALELAGHHLRRLSGDAFGAHAVLEPQLRGKVQRAVAVDPALLLEAVAVRVSRVAADELSSGGRRVGAGKETVDAPLDPGVGGRRRASVAAAVRTAGGQRRGADEQAGQGAHVPTLAGGGHG